MPDPPGVGVLLSIAFVALSPAGLVVILVREMASETISSELAV